MVIGPSDNATRGSHETYRDQGPRKKASDRSFGFVFAVVFAIIAAAQAYFMRLDWALGLASVALLFAVVAMVRPSILKPLNWLWTRFGLLLHKITNPIILGAIFFLVCAPMGMAMRLFGFDPLRTRARGPAPDSYWISREPPGPEPESMTRQF